MKHPLALCLSLVGFSLAAGCLTSPIENRATAHSQAHVELMDRPQSSLVALVRVLEALDALQDPEVEVRIRAVECDTLPSLREKPPHVRVVLHLTFYAVDYGQAERAEENLLAALREEGLATTRQPVIASGRIQRVFEEMPWNAPRVHTESDFAGLVSLSNSLQIDVYEGPTRTSAEGPAMQETSATRNVRDYIEEHSTSPALNMGSLSIDLSRRRLRDQRGDSRYKRTDLRYRIQPVRQGDSFGRNQIGHFLFALEAGSPGVRLTHLQIAPSDPGEDLRRDHWTFAADLTVRLSSDQQQR